MIKFIKKYPFSVLLSILLHIAIVLFFTIKWSESEVIKVTMEGEDIEQVKTIDKVTEVAKLAPMKTFAVDSSQVQEKLAKIKAEQEAREKEQEMLKQLTAQEKERLKQLQKQQKAEQAKAEQAKKQAEAEQRKVRAEREKIAEAKRLAAAEKKKAEAERKKAEEAKQAALDAKKRSELEEQKAKKAEQQRLAEEKKKKSLEQELAKKAEEKKAIEQATLEAKLKQEQEQAEAELQRQLAEEAAAQRAVQKRKQMATLRETYISSITAKVKDNWRTPARISPNAQCDLKITQSPQGSITSVKVLNCNNEASRQFQQAAEKAVYRAAPLPQPPVPELFERQITFEFKP